MGLLAWIFRSSGLTHGSPPLFLLSNSSWLGTHGTKHHQQPPSTCQVNFDLENSNLPPLGEVAKCSILCGIIG
jgi:hypothetical protein